MSVDVDYSQVCTPDLPPRTEEMLQIITSESPECGDSRSSARLSSNPSQLNSPPLTPSLQHDTPPMSAGFSASQPVTSNLHPLTPPPPRPHTSTPHLTQSPPPHSPISPSHSQHSTSSLLPPSNLSTGPQPPQSDSSPLPNSSPTHPHSPPPPLPPKPNTRFQSNTSDPEQDTTVGYSYCILVPAPAQPSTVTHSTSNKVESTGQPSRQLWSQTLDQETAPSAGEPQSVETVQITGPSHSFQEELSEQTQEEQAPPPIPPKPTPTVLTSAPASRKWDSLPLTHSKTGHTPIAQHARPVPSVTQPSYPPSSLPPSRTPRHPQRVRVTVSEGSRSLPPRHIRRYPASSSGSSSTAGPGSLDEGEEEDVFLKYNQSYHTITRHFHSDRLHTD